MTATPPAQATSVADAFARARAEGRAAVIGYLPAGFPDKDASIALFRAMIEGGVDLVEVGIPYTDPVMDGPTIVQSVEIALAAGTTTDDALDVVGAISGSGAAILVMTYWNLVDAYGPARFAATLAERGGAGAITPDLTPEEAGDWVAACARDGLSHVFLAAPSSDDARLQILADPATGFIYAASLMGVTGVRSGVSGAAEELVGRLRPLASTPIAVGLGVSNGEQAREVARFADGVIVGSAFVRCVLDATSPADAADRVRGLAGELAAAVRRQ